MGKSEWRSDEKTEYNDLIFTKNYLQVLSKIFQNTFSSINCYSLSFFNIHMRQKKRTKDYDNLYWKMYFEKFCRGLGSTSPLKLDHYIQFFALFQMTWLILVQIKIVHNFSLVQLHYRILMINMKNNSFH
jgi:hypothetical protein